MKIKKKCFLGAGGQVGGVGLGGGQGGCERRIEVFVKVQKNFGGVGEWGRVGGGGQGRSERRSELFCENSI